jgi:hypothetical protein
MSVGHRYFHVMSLLPHVVQVDIVFMVAEAGRSDDVAADNDDDEVRIHVSDAFFIIALVLISI